MWRRFDKNARVSRSLVGCSFVIAALGAACSEDDGTGGGGEPGTTVGTTSSSGSGVGGQGGDGGAGGAGSGGCEDGPELHVLFIGNSHTYVNDVPALVHELACSAGTNVVVQSVTAAGLSLVDHASNPAVFDTIASDDWDFVVLQDQQQRPGFRLPEVDGVSVPAAQALVDAIRENSAATVPLFYMVWARQAGDTMNCDYYPLVCTYEGNTRAVSEGYGLYAERTSTDVIPVALAWAEAVADPTAPLAPGELWSDGSHGTVAGSYFAASMIAARLLSAPSGPLGYEAGLAEPVATYLRTKSDEVLDAHLANPRVDTVERVRVACDDATGCSSWPDTSPVVLSLSSGSCADIADGSATTFARIETTLDCSFGGCITVPLRGWRVAAGSSIDADGVYTVHAHIDLDDDDVLDTGELEACEDSAFVVGGGSDVVLTTFAPHAP